MTSTADRMGLRHAPMAFTEQGVAMLSSVLNSERAIRVNIAIMRAFVWLRGLTARPRGLGRKAGRTWSARSQDTMTSIQDVFEAIRELMAPPDSPPVPAYQGREMRCPCRLSLSPRVASVSRRLPVRAPRQAGPSYRQPREAAP